MVLPADLAAAVASGDPVEGPRTRVHFADDIDGADDLPDLLPFGTDGGGAIWYCDAGGRLERGAGAIYLLHMSCTYGDTRFVAVSYAALVAAIGGGLDPFGLPTFDDEASAARPGRVRVPGIDGLVDVVRMHARGGRPAEVVPIADTIAGGLPAQGGERVLLGDDGRVLALVLAAPTTIGGYRCQAGTQVVLHPRTGAPLRFTPDEVVEVDGIRFAANHEVGLYDEVFSAALSGVLADPIDRDGVPLAAGTRIVLSGAEAALTEGTLREDAVVGGQALRAGTWFELFGTRLYNVREPP